MGGNGWKWLEMAEGASGSEWLDMGEYSWK
jgi:hypothetical protein